ncbi:putative bifunctional diguanylate cyclase/phosphodiesterase [Alteromonas lipolytica]|nr:EAL domain-containing protein [Alteromonas lipolytica]
MQLRFRWYSGQNGLEKYESPMIAQLLLQVSIYCLFPLLLTFEKNPQTRRVSLYIYVSLVLIMGGFLGAVYSVVLFDAISLSGGTIAYGGFMMACIMMAFIENDPFILQNIVRLVLMVSVFKVLLFTSVAGLLNAPQILNPLNVPVGLFELSLPLIVLGAVLIIVELYLLVFVFDKLKRLLVNHAIFSLAYSLGFVAVILMDGVLFPLIAMGVSSDVFALIIGNLSGKALIAVTFGSFLFLFMLVNKQRMEKALNDPLLNWRLLLSSSSHIVQKLEQNEAQLLQARTVVQHSREGIAVLDTDFKIISANPALERLLESAPTQELTEQNLLTLISVPQTLTAIKEQLNNYPSWSNEVTWVISGKVHVGLLTLVTVPDRHDKALNYTASLTDISELVDVREELRYMAHHDVLTGLPNRRALQALLADNAEAPDVALLLIDLDNFKQVNDSFGHVKGDRLLVQVSRRLSMVLPDNARLFRIGGDEFSVYCKGINSATEALQLANALRLQASYPCDIEPTMPVYVDCCIGISLFPGFASTPDELYQQADTALYWAKGIGKGTVKVYQEMMTTSRRSSLTLESLLREAIDSRKLEVYLQPKIHLGSGAVHGAEVLARWTTDDNERIAPDVFIPLAEEAGLMRRLTDCIMVKACDALNQIAPYVPDSFRLAVNISASELANEHLLASLRRVLEEFDLTPSRFEIELTETALIDVELKILVDLKKAGFTLALDDFGTGYSSLSYLNRLPIDTLKIDKSFVANIPLEQSSTNLTRSIIRIARDMGCSVVAEGVENSEQHLFLESENCQLAQGYLYSKPLPLSEFIEFISS